MHKIQRFFGIKRQKQKASKKLLKYEHQIYYQKTNNTWTIKFKFSIAINKSNQLRILKNKFYYKKQKINKISLVLTIKKIKILVKKCKVLKLEKIK